MVFEEAIFFSNVSSESIQSGLVCPCDMHFLHIAGVAVHHNDKGAFPFCLRHGQLCMKPDAVIRDIKFRLFACHTVNALPLK